jgi:hypothetical protein
LDLEDYLAHSPSSRGDTPVQDEATSMSNMETGASTSSAQTQSAPGNGNTSIYECRTPENNANQFVGRARATVGVTNPGPAQTTAAQFSIGRLQSDSGQRTPYSWAGAVALFQRRYYRHGYVTGHAVRRKRKRKYGLKARRHRKVI